MPSLMNFSLRTLAFICASAIPPVSLRRECSIISILCMNAEPGEASPLLAAARCRK